MLTPRGTSTEDIINTIMVRGDPRSLILKVLKMGHVFNNRYKHERNQDIYFETMTTSLTCISSTFADTDDNGG